MPPYLHSTLDGLLGSHLGLLHFWDAAYTPLSLSFPRLLLPSPFPECFTSIAYLMMSISV